MICGRLLSFTPGAYQAILRVDPTLDDIPIEYVAPDSDRQFLVSSLTFGVQDSHVLFIQSQGLRIGALEQHLRWFLEDAGAFPVGVSVALEKEMPQQIRELEDVESIELRRPVSAGTLEAEPEAVDSLTGSTVEFLKRLKPTRRALREVMTAREALRENPVQLKIVLEARGRRQDGPSLMDEIAHVLREVDDVEMKIKAKGGVYTGDKLNLMAEEKVELELNGMPVLSAAASVMHNWLGDLLSQHRVSEFR